MFGIRFIKRCGSVVRFCESSVVRGTRRLPRSSKGSTGTLFLTTVGVTATCWASMGGGSVNFNSDEYRKLLLSVRNIALNLMETTRTITTQMDYLEHDSKDYDIYLKNPTAKDLPYLLKQFDEHGKEVWPWIWTHPNEAGPHFVFIGVNVETLSQIRKLRSKSSVYNILVIASEESIFQAAKEAGDPNIYEETHCGIVSDATLELLNVEEKILMLSDERVISFDSLTIV